MTILIILFLATCFLSYSNGANDNFKGVATLFGSRTTNYKHAIWWATITTFAGSMASIFFAHGLASTFSGKGLVPQNISISPEFLTAVGIGAAITVMVATVTGFPISTTHSLTGALVGAGCVAVGSQVNFAVLGSAFFLPLLLSPVIATVFGCFLYNTFRRIRIRSGITKEWCLCVGERGKVIPSCEPATRLSVNYDNALHVTVDTEENCQEMYKGYFLGTNSQILLDYSHFCSAGIVCFARGLNDTPKIVALLLLIKGLSVHGGILAVAVGMAAGGLLNARKVAETMSNKITKLNHGQGFTANFVTGILVILASKFGVPVSTTHVSVGSLFGIGLVTRHLNTRMVLEILLSWFVTLPVAAVFSGGVYWILKYL
ncbi:MAG: inorganic phosphate transporter [Candidatus Brocadiaceae bacterium]|uniref:inorganic phosphate transporter n=1 Tax=Candidatus Wunengus sp. YC61 TaxID=3367698 RepID=UPI0027289C73|nr:inorganic phosphate transporter [Candidatus Brocadiaceae bacterium]